MAETKIFKVLEDSDTGSILGKNDWNSCMISTSENAQDVSYCLSPFVFLYKGRNYHALYHSLNIKKVFGDERLAGIYKMGKSNRIINVSDLINCLGNENVRKELELLIKNGFIIPDKMDPYMPLKRKQKEKRFNQPNIGLMYLLISNECNLRCGYCSIESLERKPKTFKYSNMSKETARKGIDLFLDFVCKGMPEARFVFYGGEPMLNWETFSDSLDYINEKRKHRFLRDINLTIDAVSNGTLITDEIAKKLKKSSASIAVSIDGLELHHDRMRTYRDGKGSWKDSLRGFHILKKHLSRCGISCTLGPHNYEDIEEIVEFFATRLEISGLGFNLMRGLPPGNDIEMSGDIITRHLIKAYKILRRFGIFEDRIMRKISSFVNEEQWIHDCAGFGGQIALCADGIVGPCQVAADDHRFCWGHINDRDLRKKIKNSELTREWCRRSPINMKQCIDCVGLGICGGGCAEEAYIKHKDIYGLDDCFCEHCKELIKWMIDDMAEKLIDSGKLLSGKIIL